MGLNSYVSHIIRIGNIQFESVCRKDQVRTAEELINVMYREEVKRKEVGRIYRYYLYVYMNISVGICYQETFVFISSTRRRDLTLK